MSTRSKPSSQPLIKGEKDEFRKVSQKTFLSSLTLSMSFILTQVEAGILKIMNHSSNKIKIDVIPVPASEFMPDCWKC